MTFLILNTKGVVHVTYEAVRAVSNMDYLKEWRVGVLSIIPCNKCQLVMKIESLLEFKYINI